jgi:hypothetical protein
MVKKLTKHNAKQFINRKDEIHTAVLAMQSLLDTLVLSSMNYTLNEINNFKKHRNKHTYLVTWYYKYVGHLESKERLRIQPMQLFQCS